MKKKMLIVNDLAIGGGVKVLMQAYAKAWHVKYDITILTDAKCKDFYKYYPSDVAFYSFNNHFEQIDKSAIFSSHNMKYIIHKIKKIAYFRAVSFHNYDVVLSMKEGSTMKSSASLKAKRKIAWVHLDFYSFHWSKCCFSSDKDELECMKKFDSVLCVSKLIKESIIKTIGNPENLVVQYNPIDVDKILKGACENIPLSEKNVTRFVSSGRLVPIKGYDMLLEACKKLKADGFKFEVWILGEGAERSNYENIISEYKLSEVTLLGNKENPFPYIKSSDWFISSSRSEGFSLVSQEAAVLDVPLMLTDCSGVRELLGDNGEYGIIMEISTDSIYENMKKVLLNENLKEFYKARIAERKSFINYHDRLKEIENLIEGREDS